jgi:hypothetical protein
MIDKLLDFIYYPDKSFHNNDGKRIEETKNFSNRTWEFCGRDCLTDYQKNIKKQPKDWIYNNKKVFYDINSYGYRTKEFEKIEWEKSVVLFGCSLVFGEGVNENETISSYLENIIGYPVINIGIGGSSNQLIFHNSLALLEKFKKPKKVIFCWTSFLRYLKYNTFNDVELMGEWSYLYKDVNYDNSYNTIMNNLLHVKSTIKMWENKSDTFNFSFFQQTSKVLRCPLLSNLIVDKSRDLVHPGPKSNLRIANFISKKI